MRIRILAAGRLHEPFWKEAEKEYRKRLSSYADVEIVELEDEKVPPGASLSLQKAIKEKEGERILQRVKPRDFLILLDLGRKEPTSEEFSSFLMDALRMGEGTVDFAIGGTLGLGGNVRKRGNASLSFGRMTLPHQLCRVLLLEQVYRAFRIARGEPYHR